MRRINPGFFEDSGRLSPAPDSPTSGFQYAGEGLFVFQAIQYSSYPFQLGALRPFTMGSNQQ